MKKIMLAVLALTSCTAYSSSAPLNTRLSEDTRGFSGVYITSGTFSRPHKVIGILQMTQEGFKWMHEVEVVGDANPDSILYKIGAFAASRGAQGIQNLILVNLKPETDFDKISKQIESVNRIQSGESNIAEEGTKTRWEVRGEMVTF